MENLVDKTAELEVYKDLIKIGIPAIIGLLGGLSGGYFPYRIQSAKLKEESKQKRIEFKRIQVLDLIDCFSIFNGNLSAYNSMLISGDGSSGDEYQDKAHQLAYQLLDSETKLVKAKAIAGLLGYPKIIEKLDDFDKQASATIKILLDPRIQNQPNKQPSLDLLRSKQVELLKLLGDIEIE